MTEPLSPAALSVWCRFCEVVEDHGASRLGLAAALRAAADQVVPVETAPIMMRGHELDQVVPKEDGMPLNLAHRVRWDTLQSVRSQLLAIAAELKQ